MTPSQLADLLNRDAERVCQHLLPNGRRQGHEWVAGDAYGGEGRSLKIVVSGEKTGVGSDFATGETFGDLLDLWCVTQGVELREAMPQACSFMGVVMDGEQTRPKRDYQRPQRPKAVKRLNPEGRVYAYLKSRGLTDTALEDFRVSEKNDEWIVFPYLREDGHINTHYIHIERDKNGKKQCRQETKAEPCLFGWMALETRYRNTRDVVITEGQIDAITLHQCGIPALSVPNGGGGGKKQDWIENDYDRLARFDRIFLCMDQDEAGQEAEKEIIRRLGSERIRSIKLPYKDANECFQHNITNFHKYLLSAKSFDPSELKPADQFTDAVLSKFYPAPGSYQGMKSPWSHINEALRFQREELVIWSGFSGSGKSALLGQVAIQGMTQHERFAICSLEMPSKVTLWRMVRQLTGHERPHADEVKAAMDWLREKCWMVDVMGKMKTQRILEVFRYAVKRYDIRNFILDSLTKCNIREDDYDGQKMFIDELCDFNHQYQCTTHLVVHQRKPESSSIRPGKFGVRGAAAITDEANTVITVWRPTEDDTNTFRKKKKSDDITEGDKPSTILTIDKNRETGIEGSFHLFFEPESLQFHEQRGRPSIDYLSLKQEDEDSEYF